MLPDIKAAHAAIMAVVPKHEPRLAEISQLAAEQDSVHDLLARGIYGFLSEAAQLVDNGEDLVELRDELMPQGLAQTIQSTYRGQAGQAKLLRERLNPAAKNKLQALVLPDGSNLVDRVQAWLAAADRLGKLEEERARIESDNPPFGTRTVIARNQWVRTVNALLAVAALAEIDEDTDRIVFGPLRDAEAKSDARAARRSAEATPVPAPAPAPASGAPSDD
jgi:hypothetical protein